MDWGKVLEIIKWFWFDIIIIWFVWYVYNIILRKVKVMRVILL